jgi:hypothetical protein
MEPTRNPQVIEIGPPVAKNLWEKKEKRGFSEKLKIGII